MNFIKEYFPGARIYKTLIAVTVSLLVSRYILHASGFYMTVAVILALKDSPAKTKKYGKDRILGTIAGGVLGYFVLLFIKQMQIDENSIWMMITNILGIFALLWLSKLFKTGESPAAMGCVVFFSITLNRFDAPILGYVVDRVLETALGVIIAMIINIMDAKRMTRKIRVWNRTQNWKKIEEEREIEEEQEVVETKE